MFAALFLVAAAPARAADPPSEAEAAPWLEGLYRRIADDAQAGRPIVIQAHVALCSNEVIRCGGHGMGDGDDLERNLYWATSGGTRGWLSRRGSDWKEVAHMASENANVLEIRVWQRRVTPDARWARFGLKRPFDVYLVAEAWRGSAIDEALEHWVTDLHGDEARVVRYTTPTGAAIELRAGAAAHVVAWVGHNRLMDRPPYDWKAAAEKGGAPTVPRGVVAMACYTQPYLAGVLSGPARVPLFMTGDFVYAGTHALDGVVDALTRAAPYAEIRRAGAQRYALGQKKEAGRVMSAFVNPAHWKQFGRKKYSSP